MIIKGVGKRSNSRFDFMFENKRIAKSKRSTRVLNSHLNSKILNSKRSTRVCIHNSIRKIAECKRSQVTIFIIIAIVIVAGILAYFLLKDRLAVSTLPVKFQPIENYFLECVKENTQEGVLLLGQQAGYIEQPDFEPGSEYRPFSNYLSFLGTGVPYWYYVSGNNIIKEQMPTKKIMQGQLNNFVKDRLKDCDFSQYELQGYVISLDIKDVKSTIKANSVDVDIDADLGISLDTESGRQTSHQTSLQSNLGSMYDEAVDIYNFEKKNSFLEGYAVDVLRLYAPVDGVEITCAPKIWMKNDIDDELKSALEANMQAVKLKGNYYNLKSNEEKYFVQNLNVKNNINFLYSPNWPTRIDISGENNGVLLAQPVGTQQGLGILGFCYVPYHFVYDINYPVLIQIFNNNELFQFPVAVIIEKNKPRSTLPSTASEEFETELCKYKNQEVVVYTYDTNLNPIEADVSFRCLKEECEIGKTEISGSDSILNEKFPQCVNGYIIARAAGYATREYLISTNSKSSANIVLDKLYNISVDFKINSETTSDNAVIIFNSEENKQTIVWPEQKMVQLSDGYYNISIYAYRDSSITIPGSTTQKCVESLKPGLAGLFGATTENCYDLNIPPQEISNVISGGGKVTEYITESQLQSGKLSIAVDGFSIPGSLEQLQNNYNLLETKSVYIDFV